MKTVFLLVSCLMLLSVIIVVFRSRTSPKKSAPMGILMAATALIALLSIIRILIL